MLAEVRIRDLALLEEVDLELAPGLNVVSGETGEGKSLLLGAVRLLLGGRASKGLVRSGARQAEVEGRFLLGEDARARARAVCDVVEADAGEVCLRRVVAAGGASRAYVDGRLAPVGLLARLGAELVDVHGQWEHLSLARPAEQARVLDRYGGLDEPSAAYRRGFRRLAGIAARLERSDEEAARVGDRRDLLAFQLAELDELDLGTGLPALREELEVLARAEDVEEGLGRAAWQLSEGEGSVSEVCARAARGLSSGMPDVPRFRAVLERLDALRLEAEDLGTECARLGAGLERDPDRRAELESLLDRVASLARKHRVREEDLPAHAAALRGELAALEAEVGSGEELAAERDALLAELRVAGSRLQQARRRAARRLEKEVAGALEELRMPKARLLVETAGVAGEGWDPLASGEAGPGAARFLVATNPGEPPQDLGRIASGGETARIMLALRGALAGHHRIPLLVFDEIDAGIGGRVGVSFGRRVAAIAAHHQVLVVTHLPQVAAFAERHVRVVKTTRGGRTRTRARVLDRSARIEELADMLGGGVAPDAARAQAEALLEEAAS